MQAKGINLVSLLVEGADVFRTKAGREFYDMKRAINLLNKNGCFILNIKIMAFYLTL